MGIPYYFYVLMKNYPKILHVTSPRNCTDFFVDFNGAIHHVANEVLTMSDRVSTIDDAIMDGCWGYLKKCINIVQPLKMVHICTDGVAPIAKIYQQRKRRYLSVWKAAKQGDVSPASWDRNVISPGTGFMTQLYAHISQCIRDRTTHTNMHFYYSSSEEAGEGEHKIFARIASLPHDANIVIHGLDADLIMLSLMSHHANIFLMREPSGSYKDMRTNDGFMFVEIDRLRWAILQDLKIHYSWRITDDMLDDTYSPSACNMIEAYVVLCSILGNDFLPHPPTLPLKKNGYEQLLLAAKDAWGKYDHLILPNGNLNMRFVADVLMSLSRNEDEQLWKCNEEYMKRKPFENKEDPLDTYPLVHKDHLCNVIYCNTPSKWRTFYYKHLFNTRLHDMSVITTSCSLFTQGLLWVYRYYKRLPKDATWYYPYNYSPTLRDLANYVAGLSATEEQKLFQKFDIPHSKGFLHPYVQLLCIMPLQSKDILPKKVQHVMTNECAFLFPIDYHIQTYLKTHLWECTPVLPFLDIPSLESALSRLN